MTRSKKGAERTREIVRERERERLCVGERVDCREMGWGPGGVCVSFSGGGWVKSYR